jgi:hypothetical protein
MTVVPRARKDRSVVVLSGGARMLALIAWYHPTSPLVASWS